MGTSLFPRTHWTRACTCACTTLRQAEFCARSVVCSPSRTVITCRPEAVKRDCLNIASSCRVPSLYTYFVAPPYIQPHSRSNGRTHQSRVPACRRGHRGTSASPSDLQSYRRARTKHPQSALSRSYHSASRHRIEEHAFWAQQGFISKSTSRCR